MREKFRDIYIVLPTILIIIFAIIISPMALQNDTFYDIVLGQRYLTTGMFKIDDYSIHQGLVYQTHHYIVTIITYVVYSVGSFVGLYIMQILMSLIMAYALFLVNREFVKSKILNFALLLFQIFMMSPFIALRAQMYSNILFILEILFLQRYIRTSEKKYLISLSILPLLLINLHSGLIYFYFIILALFILSRIKIKLKFINFVPDIDNKQFKNLILLFLLGIPIILINPYSIDGITYGIKTLNNTFIEKYIMEFAKYNGQLGPRGTLFLILYIVLILFNIKRIKLRELVLFSGTLYMTMESWRHFSLLIISSLVLTSYVDKTYFWLKSYLSKKLTERDYRTVKKISFTTIVLVLIIFSVNTLEIRKWVFESVPQGEYPIKATEYIKEHLPKDARIFNRYEWGSYLMFNDVKVFVDSRCDLYTEEYNHGTRVAMDYSETDDLVISYKETVKKYDLGYFFLEKGSSLSKIILYDEENKVIYEDETAILIKVINNK